MTDDQFNQRFETIANHIEAVTNSLDRFETKLERLGEAQAQSEKRIDRLERVVKLVIRAGLRERRESRDKINALIDAQMRADQRMDALAEVQMRADQRMEVMAEAQMRADQRMEALAEVQMRADQRMEALAEVQIRADQRMEAMAEVQIRTDQNMDALTVAMAEMSKAVTKTNKRIDAIKRNGKGKK